jgi:hypothetical protein
MAKSSESSLLISSISSSSRTFGTAYIQIKRKYLPPIFYMHLMHKIVRENIQRDQSPLFSVTREQEEHQQTRVSYRIHVDSGLSTAVLPCSLWYSSYHQWFLRCIIQHLRKRGNPYHSWGVHPSPWLRLPRRWIGDKPQTRVQLLTIRGLYLLLLLPRRWGRYHQGHPASCWMYRCD